jgi:hypothetical protein
VPVVAMFIFIFKGLEHEQITDGCLERVKSEGLLE